MANNLINGADAFRTFTNVADKFTTTASKDGTKLSPSEIGVLQNMLSAMNSVNKEQAMNNLKHGNYEAWTELKNAK